MKILIVTKNWLGDILFQMPAIEWIKSSYPHSEIVCISPPRCAEILERHPAVSRVLLFDEKTLQRSFFERLRFGFELKKEKWDKGFLLQRSRTRAFLLWLAGVHERIGYGKGRGCFLTQVVAEPKEEACHQVEYYLTLLERAGLGRPADSRYRFYFKKEDREHVQNLLARYQVKDYACFHLGANWNPKRWPPIHFAKLADLIHRNSRIPVILTGAAEDLALAKEMIHYVQNARVVTLTAQTRLGQLGALYENALFVVSGDSGPMHIASGAGARVIALFGPTDPNRTGPRGVGENVVLSYVPKGVKIPWQGKTDPPSEWLLNIFPEQVFQELEKRNWFEKNLNYHTQ